MDSEQPSFADVEYGNRRRVSKREQFLEQMEATIPWQVWIDLIEPYYYLDRPGKTGRKAKPLAMMLRNGLPLAEALALAEALESGSPAGKVLSEWRAAVEAGRGKPVQWQAQRPFPALFVWLVQRGGEHPAEAFQKAAGIYQARAQYRADLALYAALPLSILFLGQMEIGRASCRERV